MPGWLGNIAVAPEPGSTWEEAEIKHVTPEVLGPGVPVARQKLRRGAAVCAHCEAVVSREQATVGGPLIENEARFGNRPVIAHECKQARGLVYLYTDQGESR
jgi:hypothetical protein